METIELDKGTATVGRTCVNSKWKARFLANESDECCQCGFGECKVKVVIKYNGHTPYTFVLTENEIANLPTTPPTEGQN